jgi:hypothetical protein
MQYLHYPPAWHTTAAVLAADSVSQVINNTTVWLVGILAGLATLFLTVGGVRYLMAGGPRPSATAWPCWPRSSSPS